MTKRQKKKTKNIFGIFLSFLLFIVTISFLILIKLLNIIPDKYYLIGTIIIILITLILSFFLLIKKRNKVLKIFKAFSIFITFILIIIYSFLFYYLNKTMHFIDSIKIMKEEITNYYIVVLDTSKYQETSDLYGQTIGYYANTDSSIIDSIKLNLEYKSTNDTNELKDMLFKQEVESILISDIVKNKIEDDNEDFNKNIRILETISIKNKIEDITKKVSIKNTPFNVLISGIDSYGNINQTSRNDVNIIATINPNSNEILLTSIPRDYYVKLHDKEGLKDKLTHASYYGINTVVKTIEDIFEIDINYYVKVNFSTVIDLVNELEGIDVYADQNLNFCNIKVGYNHLDGACALAFARERYSYVDGDRHRGRNQQEVIKAIFNKVTTGTTLISEYNNILQVLDGKFATNMDMNEVLNLIKYEIDDLSNYKIETVQVDGDGAMGKTYSYPTQDLWIMIPNQDTIDNAKNMINKTLTK